MIATTTNNITINTTTTTKRRTLPRRCVSFPEKDVSDVFIVPRKTESEAVTLFYSPEDCDRFRSEAQWEKLAMDAVCMGGGQHQQNIDSLNLMTQMARHHFKNNKPSSSCHNNSMKMMTPSSHQQQSNFRRHRGAPKRCAGMA